MARLLHAAHIFRIERVHSGVFSSAYTASNNMFIGLPVSIALFGEEAVIPTLLYFFANTTFFWTMGNYMESIDGAVHDQRQIPKVFSPPLCGFLLAIVLLLLDWHMPAPIMSAAKYMGGITTPLALVFIGLMIYRIGIRNIEFSKDLMVALCGRFVISPLVCLSFTMLLPVGLPELYAKVYVIQAALPCITQIAVLAKYHHADVEYATTCVASTTLFAAHLDDDSHSDLLSKKIPALQVNISLIRQRLCLIKLTLSKEKSTLLGKAFSFRINENKHYYCIRNVFIKHPR